MLTLIPSPAFTNHLTTLQQLSNKNNKDMYSSSFQLNVTDRWKPACLVTIFSLQIINYGEENSVGESQNQSKFKTRAKNETCLKCLWGRYWWNEICQYNENYVREIYVKYLEKTKNCIYI